MLYEIKIKQYYSKFETFVERDTFVLDTTMFLKLIGNSKIEDGTLCREMSKANTGGIGVIGVREFGEIYQIEISKF